VSTIALLPCCIAFLALIAAALPPSPPYDTIAEQDRSDGLWFYADAHPCVNDVLPALENRIPELKRLQATGKEVLSVLPDRTAAKADHLWPKVPDLISEKRVIAQIPGSAEGPATIVTRKGKAPMLLEGIACADQSDFRIVRKRTD
jgi:hypothetical protein